MEQQPTTTSQACKICSAPANFTNFGAISCSSCKMFFKRNAESKQDSFQCDLKNKCDINIHSRRACPACRLKKCFAVGMQIELIRGSRLRKNVKRRHNTDNIELKLPNWKQNTNLSSQLPTVNLLRSDQSTLTTNQWTLLSNLLHCYDEYSGVENALQFRHEQRCFPLRLRYKLTSTTEFVTLNMTRMQQMFEKNDDFRSIRCCDRSILLRNTVKNTECIGATFALYQAGLLHDPLFYQTTATIFGVDIMLKILHLIESFDSDATFVKLVLVIIAFSTTKYTVYPDWACNELTDSKRILQIHDSYLEIAWKYMVYKYTYQQAVLRFCHLLKCLLRVNRTIVEVDQIREYKNIIETVVEQTNKFSINN
ncbi:unnamed protein product [Adineta ricciae]|uniref:Nuclear receptor domain-containing protein n=1 Tax=Adineta ricciae TaxID=249248 RepID=A0A814P7T7_ADIRI|nr:unnamed protein product [Adineta ricciae]CAF1435522.1 unnamed protein product [Adineta ricciae]